MLNCAITEDMLLMAAGSSGFPLCNNRVPSFPHFLYAVLMPANSLCSESESALAGNLGAPLGHSQAIIAQMLSSYRSGGAMRLRAFSLSNVVMWATHHQSTTNQ